MLCTSHWGPGGLAGASCAAQLSLAASRPQQHRRSSARLQVCTPGRAVSPATQQWPCWQAACARAGSRCTGRGSGCRPAAARRPRRSSSPKPPRPSHPASRGAPPKQHHPATACPAARTPPPLAFTSAPRMLPWPLAAALPPSSSSTQKAYTCTASAQQSTQAAACCSRTRLQQRRQGRQADAASQAAHVAARA